MIRGIKLFAESHDQGYVSDSMRGNWTWFQLAILDNAQATSPKRKRDGQELVVMSHSNKVRSKTYHWLPGETFNASHDFLKSLEVMTRLPSHLLHCLLTPPAGWKCHCGSALCLFPQLGDFCKKRPPRDGHWR